MRSYEAARRKARKEPVSFEVGYVEAVPALNDDGTPTLDDSGEPVTREVDRTEVFTCSGEVSSLLLSELAYNADVDTGTPEGMTLLRQFFAQAFGDDAEYRRFFRFETEHGDDDQMMAIMAGLVEDFAGRPTKRPSTSPDTPSTNGQVSKVVSLQQGTVALPPVDTGLMSAVEDLASSH